MAQFIELFRHTNKIIVERDLYKLISLKRLKKSMPKDKANKGKANKGARKKHGRIGSMRAYVVFVG